jgi:hypothetical protein
VTQSAGRLAPALLSNVVDGGSIRRRHAPEPQWNTKHCFANAPCRGPRMETVEFCRKPPSSAVRHNGGFIAADRRFHPGISVSRAECQSHLCSDFAFHQRLGRWGAQTAALTGIPRAARFRQNLWRIRESRMPDGLPDSGVFEHERGNGARGSFGAPIWHSLSVDKRGSSE